MTQRPTANLRDFVLSIVVWIAGSLIASHLADQSTGFLRGAAVVLAIASALPWVYLVVGGIRESDEFTRQMHTLALAIGFGGVALTVMTLDWLQRAGFVGPLRVGGIGLLVVWVWWGIGMLFATRRYR